MNNNYTLTIFGCVINCQSNMIKKKKSANNANDHFCSEIITSSSSCYKYRFAIQIQISFLTNQSRNDNESQIDSYYGFDFDQHHQSLFLDYCRQCDHFGETNAKTLFLYG